MTNKIKLTESDLHRIIMESIQETMENEGLWNNIKAGAKTFMGQSGQGVNSRFKNAKANFKAQGQFDETIDLGRKLRDYIIDNQIPAETPVSSILARLFGRGGNIRKQMYKTGLPRA